MSERVTSVFERIGAWLEVPVEHRRTIAIHVLIFVIGVVVVLMTDSGRLTVEAGVGESCPRTIFCPQTISFEDVVETNRLRAEAEEKTEPAVTMLENVDVEVLARVNRFFEQAGVFHRDYARRDPTLIDPPLIASYFGPEPLLSIAQIKQLTYLSTGELKSLHDLTVNQVSVALDSAITQNNLDSVRQSITRVSLPQVNRRITNLASEIIGVVLVPNAIEDVKETAERRKAAAAAIQPVIITKKKGEKIIDAGALIDQRDMYLLKLLQEQLHRNWLHRLLGTTILAVVITLVTLLQLRAYHPAMLRNPVQVDLLLGIMLFTLMLNKVVYVLFSGREEHHMQIAFSPLPAAGLLMAILLDGQLAVFQQWLLGVLAFVLADLGARFAIVGLFGGVAGILLWSLLAREGTFRRQVSSCGLAIGLANGVGLLALTLIDSQTSDLLRLVDIVTLVGCGVGNGVFSAILANGIMPFLESLSPLTTSSKLLELADLAQPLLRRMAAEAPGTYHHSLAVGTLCEAAAKEINADALLAKIGAYYHDIGKLKRPKYFAENQVGHNLHDDVNPYMSSLILVGHIRDGLELAREHNLPDRILPFVAEHHGTTLISYFYHQARTDTEGQPVSEQCFRYPGPKPQSKETAILMLADSVEAAVRTLPQHSRSAIEGLVRKIVENKFTDEKQLDQSDLTLKELERVEQTFVRVLTSMYHARIDYPGPLSNQPKGEPIGHSH